MLLMSIFIKIAGSNGFEFGFLVILNDKQF